VAFCSGPKLLAQVPHPDRNGTCAGSLRYPTKALWPFGV